MADTAQAGPSLRRPAAWEARPWTFHGAVEAAVRFGWDGVIGPDGIFVGMSGFGASASSSFTA